MTHRLLRPLAAAAAAMVCAVSAPVPSAHAGHGDRGSAIRYATALEFQAQAAGRFGASVGRPDYFAFGNTANAIAAEAHVIEQKLIACDIYGAKQCVAHLKGLVKRLDKQEDRLSKCGYGGRDARDCGDDFADEIEDAFDDLEDEVEDLRATGPVVLHGGTPRPPIVGRPTGVYPPQGSYQPGPPAPAWNGPRNAPPSGFQYQGEGEHGGVYYGPSRGLSDPGASLGRPSDGPEGLREFERAPQPPRYDDGDFRPVPNRESYRPVPGGGSLGEPTDGPLWNGNAGSIYDAGPALPGFEPQARFDRSDRFGRTTRGITVTLVR